MADKKNSGSASENEQISAPDSPIVIHAQYIRDISFENPNTPDSLRAGQGQPEMDINIGMDARKIEDKEIEDLYEVVVNVRAEASRNGTTMFIAELQYGITVQLSGVSEEQHHPVLFIEIPRLAFPFVRQIMSDITIQGGYPPLLLNPVDFQALYMERFKEDLKESVQESLKATEEETTGNA